ncbi:hypothetical protein [Streptomyces sp. NPDC096153]|uniref:hypothetical protein n=1 Tax=Streptomyces sp. NPDC096153 TaxID=3155548 RepID=UPI003326CB5D
MDYTKPLKAQTNTTCEYCGTDVPQKLGAGRLRRFCTPWHGTLQRRRLRALGWM